jgi:von Hippel-Lindau disease tumor supressor
MKKVVLAMKTLVPAVAIALLAAQDTASAQGRRTDGCPSEAALRSLSGTERTRISFRNERFGRINVFWIDYEGQRQLYRTLAPGQTQTFQTYATHPWVLTDASGGCLSVNFADVGTSTVRVR